MLLLIDGHNLVPKIAGMSLRDLDDEMNLIELLQDYARRRRRKLEVFFDNPPTGWPRIRKIGMIMVRFTRPGSNADEEIRRRLIELGKESRNCLVVSSDSRVQGYGREVRAQVMSSETFAQEIANSMVASMDADKEKGESHLSESEMEDWLRLFTEKEKKKKT